MNQVDQSYFLKKLFEQDNIGKEILLNTKTYVYEDTQTLEKFGHIEPQVHGFKYFLENKYY